MHLQITVTFFEVLHRHGNRHAYSYRYGDSIQALVVVGCLYNGIDPMQAKHIGSTAHLSGHILAVEECESPSCG